MDAGPRAPGCQSAWVSFQMWVGTFPTCPREVNIGAPRVASAAELTPVEVVDVESPFVYPDLDTAIRGLNFSGVAVRAIENATDDESEKPRLLRSQAFANLTGHIG
jgi:hypothetical protein